MLAPHHSLENWRAHIALWGRRPREVCRRPAPFDREGGEPYLEVHHVRPLAEGGPDTADNAVGCCPNCHRQLHYDPDRGRLRRSVIGSIGRLVDYPRTTGKEKTKMVPDPQEV
ncbi:HNH endonuclease [Rhizobium favelukesii]|uniref:HNH endonuclease n=1 Tax=Rhizobium TaxID=379 RepID=UPI0035A5BAD5